ASCASTGGDVGFGTDVVGSEDSGVLVYSQSMYTMSPTAITAGMNSFPTASSGFTASSLGGFGSSVDAKATEAGTFIAVGAPDGGNGYAALYSYTENMAITEEVELSFDKSGIDVPDVLNMFMPSAGLGLDVCVTMDGDEATGIAAVVPSAGMVFVYDTSLSEPRTEIDLTILHGSDATPVAISSPVPGTLVVLLADSDTVVVLMRTDFFETGVYVYVETAYLDIKAEFNDSDSDFGTVTSSTMHCSSLSAEGSVIAIGCPAAETDEQQY
ncbi:hypothetical protein KIPB_013558, partial [Kipferlia bialata]